MQGMDPATSFEAPLWAIKETAAPMTELCETIACSGGMKTWL